MPDIIRTLSALQALLADNVTEQISPQDVRDFLVSAWPRWELGVSGAYDDFFDDDDSADWTTVAPDTGTVLWNYTSTPGTQRGIQARFAGQNATDWGAYIKPLSGITTGDYIQAGFLAAHTGNLISGICFTDGVTTAANFALGGRYATAGSLVGLDGTLTTNLAATFFTTAATTGIQHLRLTYSAANTFDLGWSLDGINFVTFGTSIVHTMTPTHGGFAVSAQNVAGNALMRAVYFHSNVTP